MPMKASYLPEGVWRFRDALDLLRDCFRPAGDRAFAGGTGQFIFISSASVYKKPPQRYVITEETPTINPFWTYSQNKIACESMLKRSSRLPWTIVRPSHTVRSMLPAIFNEGDALGRRMLAGKPVILAGDGATVWTLTRCADFAAPFVKLFGATQALDIVGRSADLEVVGLSAQGSWEQGWTRGAVCI